jgi:hypothetical protein
VRPLRAVDVLERQRVDLEDLAEALEARAVRMPRTSST